MSLSSDPVITHKDTNDIIENLIRLSKLKKETKVYVSTTGEIQADTTPTVVQWFTRGWWDSQSREKTKEAVEQLFTSAHDQIEQLLDSKKLNVVLEKQVLTEAEEQFYLMKKGQLDLLYKHSVEAISGLEHLSETYGDQIASFTRMKTEVATHLETVKTKIVELDEKYKQIQQRRKEEKEASKKPVVTPNPLPPLSLPAQSQWHNPPAILGKPTPDGPKPIHASFAGTVTKTNTTTTATTS